MSLPSMTSLLSKAPDPHVLPGLEEQHVVAAERLVADAHAFCVSRT